MADSGKIAITSYSGDASTATFALSWPSTPLSASGVPYLAESHVQVVVDSVTKTLGSSAGDGDYYLSEDGLSVVFHAASIPGSGTNNVVFTRVTPHATLYVTFTDGAPATADDLRNAVLQAIYYAEEVKDTI